MNKTVIFGASGYLGSSIIQRLSIGREPMILFSRTKPKYFNDATMQFIKINNYQDPIESTTLADASSIVFAGGLAHLKRSRAVNEDIYYDANCMSAVKLAHLAKTQNIKKFVYISTIGLHGRESTRPIDERSHIINDDPYTASKLLAEQTLQKIFRGSDTKLIILRIPMVYGIDAPGNPRLSLKWARQWSLPIKDLSRNKRTFLYIDNFTSAVETIIKTKTDVSSVYCLSDDFAMSTYEYFDMITTLHNVSLRSFNFPSSIYKLFHRLLPLPMITSIVADMIVSNAKFRDHFRWTPPYSSKEEILRQHSKDRCDE